MDDQPANLFEDLQEIVGQLRTPRDIGGFRRKGLHRKLSRPGSSRYGRALVYCPPVISSRENAKKSLKFPIFTLVVLYYHIGWTHS